MNKYLKTYQQIFEANTEKIRNLRQWQKLNPERTNKFGEVTDMVDKGYSFKVQCKLDDFMRWISNGDDQWWNDKSGKLFKKLKPMISRGQEWERLKKFKEDLKFTFLPRKDDMMVLHVVNTKPNLTFKIPIGSTTYTWTHIVDGKWENPTWMKTLTRIWMLYTDLYTRNKETNTLDTVQQEWKVWLDPYLSPFDDAKHDIQYWSIWAIEVDPVGSLKDQLYDKKFKTAEEAVSTFLDDWEVFNFMDQF